eukprot:349262-Pelagomonas_calceolata.AAC.2
MPAHGAVHLNTAAVHHLALQCLDVLVCVHNLAPCRALSRLEAGLWQLKTAPNFKQWMERMLDAAESRLRAFKGRELVHLLQALADMRWMPSHAWLASYSAIFRWVVIRCWGVSCAG